MSSSSIQFSSVLKANPYKDALGRWATKETAVTTVSMEQDMTKQMAWLSEKAKEMGRESIAQMLSEAPEELFALGKKWRQHHSFKLDFSRVLKDNPYHMPPGSPQGGQFTSGAKVGYQNTQTLSFAGKLTSLINSQGMSALDTPEGKALVSRMGNHYAKAIAHAQASGKDASNPKILFELSGMSEDQASAVTEKIKHTLNAKKAWIKIYKDQAEKFAKEELPLLIAATYGTHANAKDKAKAEAMLQQKLAKYEAQWNSYEGGKDKWTEMTTKAMEEAGNLMQGTTNPNLFNELFGKSLPDSVTQPDEFNKAVAEATAGKKTPAEVLPPAPMAPIGGGLPSKFEVDDGGDMYKKQALALNHDIGVAYYLKRHELGQDHPDTQALYKEWQKSKDWLKADDSSFNTGDHAVKSKEVAQKLWDEKSDAQKQHDKKLAEVSSAYAGKYAMLIQANSQPKVSEKLKAHYESEMSKIEAEAAKAGFQPHQIKAMLSQGQMQAVEAMQKHTNGLKDSAVSAAYLVASLKAKGAEGVDDLPAAMKSLAGAKAKVKEFGADTEEHAAAMKVAVKKAKADVQLAEKYKAMIKDNGSVLQHYEANKGKMGYIGFGGKIPDGYQDHVKSVTDSLTSSERDAIYSYTGSAYSSQNKSVVAGNATNSAKLVSKALATRTLGADMLLRRNAPQKWFFKAFGIDLSVSNKTSEADMQKLVGQTYTETAFSSTSRDPDFSSSYSDTASKSGKIQYNIRAHSGIRGIDVKRISSHDSESEVILDKNVTYVIRGIRRRQPVGNSQGGTFHWEVDVDAIGHKD